MDTEQKNNSVFIEHAVDAYLEDVDAHLRRLFRKRFGVTIKNSADYHHYALITYRIQNDYTGITTSVFTILGEPFLACSLQILPALLDGAPVAEWLIRELP